MMSQRLHQAEHWVHCRMVQLGFLTEIGLACIHRRHGDATTNEQKQHKCRNDCCSRCPPASSLSLRRAVCRAATMDMSKRFHVESPTCTQIKHPSQDGQHDQSTHNSRAASTCKGIFGRREEIEERRRVERKAPIIIENRIQNERQSHEKGRQTNPDTGHQPERFTLPPDGNAHK